WTHGRWKSEVHFAMLAHEWRAHRGHPPASEAATAVPWDQIAREAARAKPPAPPEVPPQGPDPVWLQSNRLVLREFGEQDWRPLLELTAAGAVLKRGSRLFNGGSEEAAREYVGQRLAAARERPRRRYEIVIASREPDRIIGEIHLNNGGLSFQM